MNEAVPARPPAGTAGVESRGLDPITVELIQTRLTSIVREMRTVIIRTAYSHMIIEGHDFSSAVLSPAGELVAASQIEQPTHISALSWSAREVLARYGDDIGPGDLYLHNDPCTGGSHLNDVGLFYPVFHHDRPLAIVAVMAHWQDIGGMVPGSLSGNATEIYQEGIRIPSLRIVRRGVAIEEVLDLLFANVRGHRKRGLQHAGSRPTTGVPRSDCGAGRHGVEFIVRPGNRPGYSLTANREGRPRGATSSATGADLAPTRNTWRMHARHGPARVVMSVVA